MPRSSVEKKDGFEPTLVRRGATLGANSTIVCGVTIGDAAFVGAGTVVTKDVVNNSLVVGVPARHVGWMCQCGERLAPTGETLSCGRCGSGYERVADGGIVRTGDGT